MRNLVFLAFLAISAFVVAGHFQDWYTIGNVQSAGGRHLFMIEIDGDKIRNDLKLGKHKLQDAGDRVQQGTAKQPVVGAISPTGDVMR